MNTPISTFGVGHLFGIEDIMQNRTYSVTVKCQSSTGSLYRIERSEFLSRMRRDETTYNLIKEICLNKDKETYDKIRGADIIKRLENQGNLRSN